jgi:uncharacterized membrane protein (UPF0127 family)
VTRRFYWPARVALPLLVGLVVGALLLGQVPAQSQAGGTRPLVERGRLVVDGKTTLDLLLATTPEARSQGVRGRTLRTGEGMWFAFPRETDGAFWMMGVPYPILLAWIGSDRRVIAIRRMVPCVASCKLYYPPRPFRSAIELLPTDLKLSGLRAGARVELRRTGG